MHAEIQVAGRSTGALSSYLRAARPRHWLKNLLVFLPLAAAHRLYSPQLLLQGFGAWVAFSLCASGIYFFNDLNDLAADRAHPHNRSRPLASGLISPAGARVAAIVLIATALAAGFIYGVPFAAVIAFYCATMILYSLRLKAVPILDVLILACGYAARVVAGAVATHTLWSAWLTAFCVFLFFSLALIKRYAELTSIAGEPHARGYQRGDGVFLLAQGLASGYLSVLVLALYTNTRMVQDPTGRYPLFWLICLVLLYWLSYLWLMAHRGLIREDPVAFALKDPTSRVLIAVAAAVTLFAI